MADEYIKVRKYYAIIGRKKVYDVDTMRAEFEQKLSKLAGNRQGGMGIW